MKIDFIYEWVYPFSKGGAEKRIFEYSKILAQDSGNIIRVVSMNWWGKKQINNSENVIYKSSCRKLSLQRADGQRRVFASIIFGCSIFFHTLKSEVDILDIDVFPYFPNIFAKFATILKKERPVISIYWTEYMGKKYWKKQTFFQRKIGNLLERLSYWSCDRIITNSEFTKTRLQKAFIKNKKDIIVIPPVIIDLDKINNIDVQGKVYDIIYYGRIIKHKHVEDIIKIVDKFVNKKLHAKVLIIGNGPDENKIKRLIKIKKLDEYINFISFVDKYDELIKYIKSAKIMIQPSEREGFGITVVEANACGLPVLTIDYPDNASKTLIEDGVNGFICGNSDNLYEKAVLMLSDSFVSKLSKMSKKSIQKSQEYKSDIIKKKIFDYYIK